MGGAALLQLLGIMRNRFWLGQLRNGFLQFCPGFGDALILLRQCSAGVRRHALRLIAHFCAGCFVVLRAGHNRRCRMVHRSADRTRCAVLKLLRQRCCQLLSVCGARFG